MKTKSHLEESLESSQRDIGLILEDLSRNDLRAARNGMRCVIEDMTEMLEASDRALAAYDRIRKTLKLQRLP